MQLGLCVLVIFLSSMDFVQSNVGKGLKGKRQRRISTETSQGCAKGCDLCSEFNGCLRCSPKLFILLERNDIRQIGVCLPSCPPGYFDVRNPDMNKCMKCKIDNCEDCFSRNFCTKCKGPLYLHKGRCYASCPEGSSADGSTMECSAPVPCEMGNWGPWGPCSKRRRLCGFRKGHEERSREVLQAPSGDVSLCPATTELRRCTMQRSQCPEAQKKRKEEQSKRGRVDEERSPKGARERSSTKRRKGQPGGTAGPVAAAL
uniref:R-spondin 1 n=1 Tax=Salvator merianae TaxID=96440 RepID=A0A8D0E5T7_SALMN